MLNYKYTYTAWLCSYVPLCTVPYCPCPRSLCFFIACPEYTIWCFIQGGSTLIKLSISQSKLSFKLLPSPQDSENPVVAVVDSVSSPSSSSSSSSFWNDEFVTTSIFEDPLTWRIGNSLSVESCCSNLIGLLNEINSKTLPSYFSILVLVQ